MINDSSCLQISKNQRRRNGSGSKVYIRNFRINENLKSNETRKEIFFVDTTKKSFVFFLTYFKVQSHIAKKEK